MRRAARRGGRPRPSVAIVGLGLVGGSLARALTRAGYEVIGLDRPRVRRAALRSRAVARTVSSLAAAARADVVVLAAPPRSNLALLRALAPLQRPGLTLTDVGSVKLPICREARRLGLRGFVGGHPMAGTEGSGLRASSPDLFRGRPWLLCPGEARDVRRVAALARAAGARPVRIAAAEHDRSVAFLSHLPQVVAWALHSAASRDGVARRRRHLAGPAFQEVERLARSPRALWREILGQNRPEIERALRAFRRTLAVWR